MQLRERGLLLTVIGVPKTDLNKVLRGKMDIYQRATSVEGLLCIRKYWDSHCSMFHRLPAVALLHPGSCPRGLAAAECVALIRRLTDLQHWQAWELWDTLDITRSGLLGCTEFTLLVVLLCAGLAQQQLRAVHAYAHAISRVFTGAHVASSYAGLQQCCQLLGLVTSDLSQATQQLQLQWMSSNDSTSNSTSGRDSRVVAAEQGASSNSSSNRGSNSSNNSSAAGKCSGSSTDPGAGKCTDGCKHGSAAGPTFRSSSGCGGEGPAATGLLLPLGGGAGAAAHQQLGCCCKLSHDSHSCQSSSVQQLQQQQWACGAAAHRQHCAAGGANLAQRPNHCKTQRTAGLLAVQDVELVLFCVIQHHKMRQELQQVPYKQDDGGTGCCGAGCRIS